MVLCVDTDFVVDLLAQRSGAEAAVASMSGPAFLPAIAVHELLFSASERRIAQVETFVRDYPVIPVDFAVSSLAAEIQRDLAEHGQLIPDFDALIAATAILANATLVTSDAHYDRVPSRFGLSLQRYRRE